MPSKDHYATLGVAHTATPEEIKQAFRRLARKYHPDVSQEPQAEARFKSLAVAHEVLSDPQRRARYDQSLLQSSPRPEPTASAPAPRPTAKPKPPSAKPEPPKPSRDFAGLFSAWLGRNKSREEAHSRSPKAERHKARASDRHARIEIEWRDAYLGAERRYVLQGSGAAAPAGATGAEPGGRELTVKIPRGVAPGQQLRLAGMGLPGVLGQEPGDLYLEVVFTTHPQVEVRGRDVQLQLPVAPWEAALGASVELPMPDGAVQLSIPPGSKPGRKLRLRGKGLPGSPPGDLYVELVVALPTPDTTDARDAYSRLAQSFPSFNPRKDFLN